MNAKDWAQVKYFKETENWGSSDKMLPFLIYELDAYRERIGIPILVTSGWRQTSKFDNSQHPLGRAVDIMFPTAKLGDLLDLCFEAMRFDFTGIGLYNYWQLNGKTLGGLHLDCRNATDRSFWISYGAEKDQYLKFTVDNLIKYGFIPKPLIE